MPYDYRSEERKFIFESLGDRLSRRSEKRWRDFFAAANSFLEVGDMALPEFMRRGGWDDGILSALLNEEVKKTDLWVFSLSASLAGLRHRAQGEKDSGRDAAARILREAGKTLVPSENDQSEGEFRAAREASRPYGDRDLPQILRHGGWDHFLTALLKLPGKEARHPRIRGVVKSLIRLRRTAKGRADRESQKARAILRDVGNTLAPDLRGRRRQICVEDPDMVAMLYYQEVFRWHHIYHFLKVCRATVKDQSTGELLEEASRLFDISVEDLRSGLHLDEDFHPLFKRLLPVKKVALERVSSSFGLDEESVQNILSAY